MMLKTWLFQLFCHSGAAYARTAPRALARERIQNYCGGTGGNPKFFEWSRRDEASFKGILYEEFELSA
jgi:hypothetical protein